jgi:hypothetical protein
MRTVALMLLLCCSAAFAQTPWRNAPWPDATVIALDGQPFTVPPNTVVWWGSGTRWIMSGKMSGAGWCDKRTFRFNFDAAVAKKCVVEYPPPWISPGGLVFPKTTGVDAACAPAPLGRGTLPIVDVNSAGVMLAYWCHATATKPSTLSLFAAQWWALDVHLVGKLAAVMFSADPTTAIRALAAERASVPIDKLLDVWGPSQARLIAARPPSAPQ